MEVGKFLSIPENRAAVAEIVSKVLTQIAPDEQEITDEFLEPLLDLAAEGEVPPVDTSDEATSFGGLDLMVQVLVPTVVGVMANLLSALGIETVKALRERRRREVEDALAAQLDSAKRAIRRTRSPRARRQKEALARAVLAEIADSVTSPEERQRT